MSDGYCRRCGIVYPEEDLVEASFGPGGVKLVCPDCARKGDSPFTGGGDADE